MDSSMKKRPLFDDFPPVDTSEWLSVVEKDLKGKDFEKSLVWKTDEKFSLQPFYRKQDISHLEGLLNKEPGEFPYIRGNKKHSNSWNIDVFIKEDNPENANQRALNAVNSGADSLTFHQELFKNKDSVSTLLKNIDPANTAINVKARENLNEICGLISKQTDKSGKNKTLGGFFTYDPVTDAILNGKSSDVNERISGISRALNDYGQNLDCYRMFTVHSFPYKSSGGNIVQELAFTLNSAVEYLSALTELGLDIDSICKRLAFSISVGPSYFMEISKLRAARVLWAKIVEQHNPRSEDSYKMFIHARTASFNMTVYDPYVNILRGTTETMAAAVGGADSITIDPFDSCYREPDRFSEKVARNTQLIAREEAYLNKVIDPGAGSYYIEKITESLCEHTLNLFKKVEDNGGLLNSMKNGFVQETIEKNRSELVKKVSRRNRVLLGTNHYPYPDEKMMDKLDKFFRGNGTGIKSEGESDFIPLTLFRGSELFEKIRFNTEKYANETGNRPKVFLLQLGNLRMRRARANFAYNFFGCAGFEIIDNSGFETVEIGVKTALQSNAQIVVVCSSNEEYAELVPGAVKKLREKKPDILVVVAGFTEKLESELKDISIDDFIHAGSDAVEFLARYQNKLGIKKP